MLIFESSKKNRSADSQIPWQETLLDDLPSNSLRTSEPFLPEISELQVVRHYTKLSQQNFSVDTHFYPLGSCSMKYNPHCMSSLVSFSGFVNCHPLNFIEFQQGTLECLFELQEMLKEITGMSGVSLTPIAGAQGEFAGIAMIRAYHLANQDMQRTEMIVPDAAHGTNPASAVMCGYQVKEVPTKKDGDIDIETLKKIVGPQTAGIMLTNPSTLGVFERQIQEIEKIIHDAGGLLYYDGANLNAILGKVRPGDMGFDVLHLNLHKTFATPHGGGGPGSGPIAANKKLQSFLPIPFVLKQEDRYEWAKMDDFTQSIGRLSAFMGNVAVALKASIFIRLIGREGLARVAEISSLNANYLMKRLNEIGFEISYPQRRAGHEFVMSLQDQTKKYGVRALDYAKRLLDYGVHAPTIYFPLLVPECMLIEPTETEDKETLDRFVEIMKTIREEVRQDPDLVKTSPHNLTLGRLDDVKAAREPDLIQRG